MTTDIVPPADRLPWERQPGETGKAFAAFVLYRDQLDQRSLTNVARLLHEGMTGKRPKPESIRTQLGEWSARYDWVERADAYLDHLERRHREARETELDRVNERTRESGALLTTLGLRRFHGGTVRTAEGDKLVAPLDLNDATVADAIRLVDTGLKYQRLGSGLPTEALAARLQISRADLDEIVDKVSRLALSLMPEELHERFWLGMERIAQGGQP